MPSRDSHHNICKRRCEIVGTTVGADLVSARIYNNNSVYVIRHNRADTRSAPTKRVPLAMSVNDNLPYPLASPSLRRLCNVFHE